MFFILSQCGDDGGCGSFCEDGDVGGGSYCNDGLMVVMKVL